MAVEAVFVRGGTSGRVVPVDVILGILGVELGVSAVRGVIYDPERQEIVLAAECPLTGPAHDASGALNEQVMLPALDDVLYKLDVTSPATVRAGLTIGPNHGGVGSGPALQDWLIGKSKHIGQPITYSGNIGISFAPLQAVEEAQQLASLSGLVLDRVELAPVAAARVLGQEVEDVITVGSGRGWRARIRRFEVLEAVTTDDVSSDDPLQVISSAGQAVEVESYSSVTIAESLYATSRLDLAQLAVCVGAALGVAYDSGGSLLVGQVLGEDTPTSGGFNKAGPKQPRQAAADFFTRTPRKAELALEVDRGSSEAERQFEQRPVSASSATGFSLSSFGNGGRSGSAASDNGLAPASEFSNGMDAPLPVRDPYAGLSRFEDAEPVPEIVDGGYDVAAYDPYSTNYGVGPADPFNGVSADPAVNAAETVSIGVKRIAPVDRLPEELADRSPSPADFEQTYHQPVGPPGGESYDRPMEDASSYFDDSDGFGAAPSGGGMGTATVPPPVHREEQEFGFDDGLGEERGRQRSKRVHRDRSRGTNQPALVPDDALIAQFSPKTDAENWEDEGRGATTAVLVFLALSAIVLLLLYIIL